MDEFVFTIIDRQKCSRHNAPSGTPCWHIIGENGFGNAAICNKRAKSAGFVGKISRVSLGQR